MNVYDFEESKKKILARRIGLAILSLFPRLNEPGVLLEIKQKYSLWIKKTYKSDE